jgi:serine-type D-Ala-D-Ala carboxypeptidase/endopeptidase (penicillin-binding protein 4)
MPVMDKVTKPSCYVIIMLLVYSCTANRHISRQAQQLLLQDSIPATGHIGISIYEPATNRYWYTYNATKYFTPASNTKLFTLYAGLKFLGDSLTGLQYQLVNDTAINVHTTGDPTLLHPDFKQHPVLDFLKAQSKPVYVSGLYEDDAIGSGWAWNDFAAYYSAERNALPVYGNIVSIKKKQLIDSSSTSRTYTFSTNPAYFNNKINGTVVLPDALKNNSPAQIAQLMSGFDITRSKEGNYFSLILTDQPGIFTEAEIPFYTNGNNTAIDILNQEYGLHLQQGLPVQHDAQGNKADTGNWHRICSQPTDTMLKYMMHRSDNFYAEQVLVMISRQQGNHPFFKNATTATIDAILQQQMPDIPQPPQWVDGSGLSRYNLFTPQDFVYILTKMKNEFGLQRLKTILPTGGQGTLSSYYKQAAGFIFAKTGTLSNQVALSGYLYTQKNKLLIFSLMANNVNGSATGVRRAFEKFLLAVRQAN